MRKKTVRTKGKFRFSRFFQKLNKGEKVAVIKEDSLQPRFPKRIQGRTGVVEGRVGKAYFVTIKDQEKEKKFLIEPIHLKKIGVKEK